MQEWIGKSVVIVGAARQGLALARYLTRHGAQVVLNDRRPAGELHRAQESLADLSGNTRTVRWVCGGHPLSLLEGTDLVCVSGGVPLDLPLVIEARRRGIPLSNDSQIFLAAAPCKVIGITGSAGKTTTTTLVGRMAEESSRLKVEGTIPDTEGNFQLPNRVWVGGNIGSPLIAMIEEMEAEDLAVMELSSFQLEIMSLSPQVAAVLNVTPNHLDRHATMEDYTAAKARILDFQTPSSAAVLGRDDPGAWSLKDRVRGRLLSFGLSALPDGQEGTFVREGEIYLRLLIGKKGIGDRGIGSISTSSPIPSDIYLMSQREILLRGEHNLLNVLAACAIAAAAGLPEYAMQAGVADFRGVPHRLEFVRKWGGAEWYNDSIATAPERAMAAIRSFDEPLVLLAGGRDKNLPWADFAALVQQRVDRLIVFGEAAEKIMAAMTARAGSGSTTVTRCAGLYDAVQAAAQIVQPGDVVLLSPGGTSFDEFRDFEERGECFVRWVMQLP